MSASSALIFVFALFIVNGFAGTVFPYFPKSSDEVLAQLNSTVLQDKCTGNKIKLAYAINSDRYPYIGDVEPTVYALMAGHGDVSRKVLVTCGWTARAFISTDVCLEFINQLCSGNVPDYHNTVYMIIPMVNQRMLEFVRALWPEFRGETPRSWDRIVAAVPPSYQRLLGEISDPQYYPKSSSSSQSANGNRLFNCFDGSYRMTRLDQNFPAGWMQRLATDSERNPFVRWQPTAEARRLEDIISINGRIPQSDPEARIINEFLSMRGQIWRWDVVIEVAQIGGVDAVLAPFESPVSMVDQDDSDIASALKASRLRAEHLAENYCPSSRCLGGVARVARAKEMAFRSGTLADQAIYTGAAMALILQIGPQPTQAGDGSGPADCLKTYAPAYQDDASALVKKWTDLLIRATRKV